MTSIEQDAYGFPTTFECQDVNVAVTPVTMTFYYDMAFTRPDSADELEATQDLARAYVEGSLLQQLAAYYGFWDGLACGGQLPDRVWFVKLSSLTLDIRNPKLCEYKTDTIRLAILIIYCAYTHLSTTETASCFELVPKDNEECVSFIGTMTGDIVGSDDTIDTISLVEQQMNADAVTATTENIRVKFLGTELDYGGGAGRDNLPPAKNVVADTFAAPQQNSFTLIGVAIVAGLSLALVGAVIVLIRKRRNVKSSFEHQEFQDEVKSTAGSDFYNDDDVEDKAKDLSREITPNDDDDGTLPETPDEFSREYNFDLGGWMKSELLGIHGGTTITAQPSRGEEGGLSDSDNDSWAQTEGTIGSLELRLDPIEAEV